MRKVCPLAVLVSTFLVLSAAAEEVQLPVVGMMSERYRNYDVRGEEYSDGSIHVWATTDDGKRLFDSRYPVRDAGGRFLKWTYDGDRVTQSTPVTDAMNPTLEGMFFAGKDVIRMLEGGAKSSDGPLVRGSNGERLHVAPADDWGCDELQTLSCSPKGVCCDIHDDCYYQNGCSALSWLGLSSPACTACNIAVVYCFADSVHIGQSACCVLNKCGQPWEPPSGGGVVENERRPLNIDPDLGGGGGGGGFTWAWTPYGTVGISYGSFCVVRVGNDNIYTAC